MSPLLRLGLVCLGICCGPRLVSAETLRIAAASNLQFVLPQLLTAYTSVNPQTEISPAYAASGSLVAQVRHGAPFDIFLSADLKYPQALIESGHAAKDSLQTFAHGILMLWPDPGTEDWGEALRAPATKRIAIAHSETAPYGTATERMLRSRDLWPAITSKVVWGKNVAQTLHFVHSGNADYGFVAASLLVANPALNSGLTIDLGPQALPHGAVRLKSARNVMEADKFLVWLKAPTARKILGSNGYRLP